MISIKVKDQMSSPVISVDSSKTLREAVELMSRHQVGSVIVETDKKANGIITERDIVKAVHENRLNNELSDYTSRPLITIGKEAPLGDAAQLMLSKKIRRLGVTDQDGQLVGVINIRDMVTAVHESFLTIFDA